MPNIQKLAPQEAQKIAAGEVIERPANIVKELVENAIDADATRIDIAIANGGKQQIKIIDNGCGMDTTDAQNCFEHHATSKIKQVTDLESIGTFGFRGEALSSIASVTTITLITKTKKAPEGTKVLISGANVQTVEPCSAKTGTSITVSDLFFNVPARQKFLKKDETEWRHITKLFYAFVLCYPHIHFTLHHNGKQQYNCPSITTLADRFVQLNDSNLGKKMLPVSSKRDGYSVSGCVSDHHYFRYDRSNIFLFVNKRWVKNNGLIRAVVNGYQNVLQPGKFPAGVIHITLDQHELDVNIHPRKEEVQFTHPRIIETLIKGSVKDALEQAITKQLQQTTSTPVITKIQKPIRPFTIQPNIYIPQKAFSEPLPIKAPFTNSTNSLAPVSNKPIPPMQNTTIKSIQTKEKPVIIGQYNKTYIMLEHANGILLIDQHAAHERILYEQFTAQKNNIVTVPLMFTQRITLSKNDIAAITPHLELLKEQGFVCEVFGENQICIRSIPVYAKNIKLEELITQFVSWVTEHTQLAQEELLQKVTKLLHADVACKAAVKAGDILDTKQMSQLVQNLKKTINRLTCPHGRPTSWLLPLDEVIKKFKRDYKSNTAIFNW